MPSSIAKALKRQFDDLPIVEGRAPLRMYPIESDREGAIPKDPERCVISKCGQRMYQSKKCLSYKGALYIDLVNEDGAREINRLRPTQKTRQAMIDYDRKKEFPVGIALVFVPFAQSSHLKAKRKKNSSYRSNPKTRTRYLFHSARTQVATAEAQLERARTNHQMVRDEKPNSAKLKTATKRVELAKATIARAKASVDRHWSVLKKQSQKTGQPMRINKRSPPLDLSIRQGRGLNIFFEKE